MMPRHLRPPTGRHAAALGSLVVLIIAAGAVLAACGGSSNAATTGGSTNATTGRTAQVLATVRRGNLVQIVAGRLQLTSVKSKVNVKAVVQVSGTNATQVAVGQPVTVVFVKLPAGARRFFGSGSPRPYASASGAPSGSQGGAPSGGQNGAPSGGSGYGSGGQGFFGQGGQGGQGAFGGKTAQGTVTAIAAGSNGSVSATVTMAKLPAGVTTKYTGIAQIQVKVLASNVLIIPTAAIKGSGSGATVQLLAGGKTSTQSVVVGQQVAGESEISSGLSVGQNVVYTRRFSGFGGGFRSGQGGSGFPQGGQQSNSTTSGT
jgi:membrane fusion protein, macrolide-specific efflux system